MTPTHPASAGKPPDGVTETWLDWITTAHGGYVDANTASRTRDELVALRARVADLEMMLRAAKKMVHLMDTRLLHASKVADYAEHRSGCMALGEICSCRLAPLVVEADDYNTSTGAEGERTLAMICTDDGTGLPLLTDAARAALAREGERRE